MARKKLSPEQEKELKLLVSNYEMLKNTKANAELRGNKESVKLIDIACKDSIEQIRKIDAKTAKELETNVDNNDELTRITSVDDDKTVYDKVAYYKSDYDEKDDVYEDLSKQETQNNEVSYESLDTVNDFDLTKYDVQYDIISLPSNGQCYKKKIDRIPVGYLTAYDENLITSPNLYKDGLIIDFLLKHKVLDKNINIDELCNGDVDAITLFLRATSYGPEFPIIVRDPETSEQIDSVVDLSELKVKEFNLVGDADGYFDYTLPVSKDTVKFKFLTRKDEKMLKLLSKIEDNGVKSMIIKDNVNTLKDIIKTDKSISGKDKQEYINNLTKLTEVCKELEKKSNLPFSKSITNRLELSIMAVNGNYDKSYISKYIRNMGAKDSLMLRRYMIENEPGINFEIEVKRPESLGGGSFKTFLEWDDSIFLNIA